MFKVKQVFSMLTWGMALVETGGVLVATAGPFLAGSSMAFWEELTGESTVSDSLSGTTWASGMACRAGATPLTCGGGRVTWASGTGVGSGGGGAGGLGSSRDG